MLEKNIFLTGFMGTGKSTVGKLLAKQIKRGFIDLDHLIEFREGRTVSKIFEVEGESYFRNLESSLLKEICNNHRLIIATGGGSLLSEENFQLVQKCGLTILLKADPEIIALRVRKERNIRPLLSDIDEPISRIISLLEQREDKYNRFKHQIDTSALNTEQVVAKIIELVLRKKNDENN